MEIVEEGEEGGGGVLGGRSKVVGGRGGVDTTEASHFSDYRSAHSIFNDPIRNRFSS